MKTENEIGKYDWGNILLGVIFLFDGFSFHCITICGILYDIINDYIYLCLTMFTGYFFIVISIILFTLEYNKKREIINKGCA